MSAESRFIDTNVLVYLFDTDAPARQAVARGLLAAGPFVLSTQMLSAFFVTVTRKLARPLAPERARRPAARLSRCSA